MRKSPGLQRQLGLISLVLVMAFGGLGVEYATWTQGLYATATAEVSSLSVNTSAADGIASRDATLHGALNGAGGTTASVYFEYGDDASYPAYNLGTVAGTPASFPSSFTPPGSFSATLCGLSASTGYHFRAKAVGYFTTYGVDETFTTTGGNSISPLTFDVLIANDTPDIRQKNDPAHQGPGGATGSSWNFTTSPFTWNGRRDTGSGGDRCSIDSPTGSWTWNGTTGTGTITMTMHCVKKRNNYEPALAVRIKNNGTAGMKVEVTSVTQSSTTHASSVYFQGGVLRSAAWTTIGAGTTSTGEYNMAWKAENGETKTVTFVITARPS